jgi:hypothetical protein
MIYPSTHPAVEIPEGSLHDQVRWSASPLPPALSG